MDVDDTGGVEVASGGEQQLRVHDEDDILGANMDRHGFLKMEAVWLVAAEDIIVDSEAVT
jgi:hypothetical protein